MNSAKKAYWIPQFDTVHTRGELTKLANKGKPWPWVRVPTRFDGEGFRTLMATPGGVAAFGVYILLVELAANTPTRGLLANDKGPLTPRRIATKIGVPVAEIEAAMPMLADPEIGWLVDVEVDSKGEPIADQMQAKHEPDANQSQTNHEPAKTQNQTNREPDESAEQTNSTAKSNQTRLVLDVDVDVEKEKEVEKERRAQVRWSKSKDQFVIDDQARAELHRRYNDIDVDQQILAAAEWMRCEEGDGPDSPERFLRSWLNKAQEQRRELEKGHPAFRPRVSVGRTIRDAMTDPGECVI